MATVIIGECKEPWLYWWELLPIEERKAIKQKYFAESWPNWKSALLEPEIKEAWEQEKPEPIRDEDWLHLAIDWLEHTTMQDRRRIKEIWRQVYRIASKRI